MPFKRSPHKQISLMVGASSYCDCTLFWFWRDFKISFNCLQFSQVFLFSPCKAVGINVGTPSGWQRLKVLVVNDESHSARPGGHAVRHLVARSQHGRRFNDDVVRLEGGVSEVEALHLAPWVLLWQVLAAVRHQTGVKYQRIFVLKDFVKKRLKSVKSQWSRPLSGPWGPQHGRRSKGWLEVGGRLWVHDVAPAMSNFWQQESMFEWSCLWGLFYNHMLLLRVLFV